MSDYTIKLTNNTTLTTIPEGEINDTSCSLTLFGKNSVGYGLELNENMVQMLEHFASNGPPLQPLQGQLWWDTTSGCLKVRRDNAWSTIGTANSSVLRPSSSISQPGDLWWDPTNEQLNAFDGTDWIIVGPIYTAAQGVSGSIAETILDNTNQEHTIVKLFVNGNLLAVLSTDATPFTPVGLPGFSVIKSGFNLPFANGMYYGTAENALSLGGVVAANYLRSDVPSTTNFSLNVKTNTGLTVGLNDDLTVKVEGNATKFFSNTIGRNQEFYVTTPTGVEMGLKIDGQTGLVAVASNPVSAMDVVSKGYADTLVSDASANFVYHDGSVRLTGSLLPDATGSISLGSSSFKYNSVYANSVISSAVNSAAGTFTSLSVGDSPTTSASATNKQYVDGMDANLQSQMIVLNQETVTTIVGPSAPPSLSTISALASAINNSPTFGTDITTSLTSKAPIASPTFTGTPRAPNPVSTSNSTQIATTYFTTSAVSQVENSILTNLGNNYAPLESPDFTGSPTAPTQAFGDTTSKLANTNFVMTAITALVEGDTPFTGTSTFNNITVNNNIAAGTTSTTIGSSSNRINTVYASVFNGLATTAAYADLAENYVADAEYAPGTVLDFGGDKEVTLSTGESLTRVAGVVSTAPAHLMNADCSGEHVVSLALQGRCPVRVIGFIQKGDLLISAGNGVAKRTLNPQVGTIIGKALMAHAGEESLIEVAIGRC